MEEILDDIKVKNRKRTFTRISFVCALITLITLLYLMSSLSGNITASEGIPKPPIFLLRAIQIMSVLGMIFTGMSFIKKEASTWLKWIATIANGFLFLLIIGSVVVLFLVDLSR